jgi:Carbohydrate esterase, sialic acid-specific acetylesterase
MKPPASLFRLAALAGLFCVSSIAASATILRVVLVGGQSNSDGRAPGSGLPTAPVNLQLPQANVPFYYYTFGSPLNPDGTSGTLTTLRPGATEFPAGGFGPEVKLGYDLSRAFEQQPGTALAIIKYAKGPSSLHTDWKAGGDATLAGDGTHYQKFQQVVTAGMAKLRAAYPADTVLLAAMVWVQGESDLVSTDVNASAYGANLTAFIADLRLTLDPTLPFFLSRISDRQTTYVNNPNYPTIRTRQAEVAANVAGAYLIDTDGPAFNMNADNYHYSASGQQALGAAFAARMQAILILKASCSRVGGGMQLNWNSIPGKSYQIRKSADLKSWTTISAGVTNPYFEAFESGVTTRFFQVAEK